MHRDIKPNNILLLPDDTPVLIDFGLARESESGPTSLLAAFTPGYSPLEQNSKSKRGPWTDLYALGATCYFLLTRENPPDCHERTDDAPYRPLSQRPELSGRFSTAVLEGIDRALRMPRHERWQTAQAWLDSLHGKEPHAEVVSGCKSRPRRGKAVFAAALLLLAAAGTVSYYQGLAAAQYSLGFCYYNGYGVPQDYAQAVQWYRKAAEQGNAAAQEALRQMRQLGQ